MTHIVVAKQASRQSCANYVMRWKGHHRCTRACLRQWLTVAAAAVKNMQFCSVHWLCCSKLMMKKRKKSWRNEKDGGFAEGLRGASSSAHVMLWWRKLKWRTPEHLQTLSAWIHIHFNIFFTVNRPQRHNHVQRNTTFWATCCNSSLFSILHNLLCERYLIALVLCVA